jgi:esterase/lipase
MRRLLFVLATAAALLVAGCAGASSASPLSQSATPITTTPGSPAAASPTTPGAEVVTFPASDGVAIDGRVYGSGAVGVVLAHGDYAAGQDTWTEFATTLATHGLTALTFNFRSLALADRALLWHDVVGAVTYLHGRGIRQVFLIGASLGAHWVLWAAAQEGVAVSGVVGLSAAAAAFSAEFELTATVLSRIHVPVLLISGTRDDIVTADEVQALFDRAAEPKTIHLLETSAHGAALLSGAGQAPVQARAFVFAFLGIPA